jgi:phage shock protein PspC (stress-responsive transcriptional regulator)
MKKLTKSKSNKLIVGICAGLAEYFCADVNLVRLIAIYLGCLISL